MKLRILFVDDDPNVLQGYQRMLYPQRHEWEMNFTSSGDEALEFMATCPVDVIVSDMRMPGMSGAQLLTEVTKKYSGVVRLALSGYADEEMTLKSVRLAHQYLTKPCDADTLISAVKRICGLRNLLSNESLRTVISQFGTLPSIPSLYLEIVDVLNSPKASVNEVGQVISKDMGMTVKILQLVNSGYFGLSRRISNTLQAVSLLGLETIKGLVLTTEIFSKIDQQTVTKFKLDDLWTHSLIVGRYSKEIAKAEAYDKELIEDCFLAGLLHDIGKLILADCIPEDYSECLSLAQNKEAPPWEIEREILGATHGEVGAYLIGLWGLPASIVEAVVYHHSPSDCPSKTVGPVPVVHFANAVCSTSKGFTADPFRDKSEQGEHQQRGPKGALQVDSEYLKELGLGNRISKWMTLWEDINRKKDTQ